MRRIKNLSVKLMAILSSEGNNEKNSSPIVNWPKGDLKFCLQDV